MRKVHEPERRPQADPGRIDGCRAASPAERLSLHARGKLYLTANDGIRVVDVDPGSATYHELLGTPPTACALVGEGSLLYTNRGDVIPLH